MLCLILWFLRQSVLIFMVVLCLKHFHVYGILYYENFVLLRLISTWRMAAVLAAAQFRPSRSFSLLKREFGSKREKISFHAEWCQQFEWLHYDVDKDAAFC